MNWNDYEGREAGEWPLDSFLGERDGKVFFITHRPGTSNQLLLQLLPRDAAGAGVTRESWNIARELNHENLLRPYATGECLVGGVGVHYAVLDLPDDDLGEVLNKQVPKGAAARNIAAAIDNGLKYLHARGLSHGAVTPANVFFLPGGVKLSADTIRPVGDTDADLRQLRELRAKLGVSQGSGNRTKVIVAGSAAALAAVALLLYKPHAPAPAPAAVVERPKVVHAVVAEPKKTPFGPPTATMNRIAKPTYSGNSWGVVAATYRDYGMADKYATILRKRLPQIKAHAYPPDGQGKLYLVVLGSGMTREQADELRSRVVTMGAPRDCYVTKLDSP